MAKAQEPHPFIDMFAKLGRDMKLPDIDIERIIEHHRRNLEALEKSARTASSGAAAMMVRQREMIEEALGEAKAMAEHYRAPSDPRELMAKQIEFARKSFETAVRNAGEMADLAKKSGTDSIDILRQRIREGLEEMRDAYEKRK
jgi:phasin family protein